MDKEKYNFPCPAREQATRLTQASPVTEWEQAGPMGWTGSLLTDLLQLLPACGTDLRSQPASLPGTAASPEQGAAPQPPASLFSAYVT